MEDIYIITTSWGEYEMNHDRYEGYVLSEEEAKEICLKLDAKYDILHPVAAGFTTDEFSEEYDNIATEFENLIWKWEYIRDTEYEEKISYNLYSQDKELYDKLTKEFIANDKAERLKWFTNNADAQKYLPEGYTWEILLEKYDFYNEVKQDYYCYAHYEKVSPYKD